MNKKIICILIFMLVFSCTFSAASVIENKEAIDNTTEIGPNPNDPKVPMESGNWFIAKEFGPDAGESWPYKETSKSHSNCVTDFNLNTGVGEVYAYPMPFTSSWAQVDVHAQQNGNGWVWNGDTTNARVVIKSSSYANVEVITGANSKIKIIVKEYTPTGQYSQTWDDVVFTGLGDWSGSLDGLYLDHTFRHNYIYKLIIVASCYQGGSSWARFDPIKLKKVWWLYEEEESSITLEEPDSGYLYLGGNKLFHTSLPFALLFMCPGVQCVATTTGSVDYVKFECDGKKVEDTTPSGNTWSGLLKGASGLETVYAKAYDNSGNQVASDSVRIFKIGGS